MKDRQAGRHTGRQTIPALSLFVPWLADSAVSPAPASMPLVLSVGLTSVQWVILTSNVTLTFSVMMTWSQL